MNLLKKLSPYIVLTILLIGTFQQALRASDIGLYVKNISADSTDFILLVDKSQQKLFVIKSNAPQTVTTVDTFRITTGRADGNKEKEGDLKTPEGIYRIVSSIPGETLPPKYGPIAFVLDYPNRVDQIQNRNGSNIWIHGRDEEIIDRQTEGCVSLENGRLLELSDYITLQKTPVIIIDSLYHNGKSQKEDFKFYLADTLIVQWKTSWESGDIDALGRLLSDHFKTQSYANKDLFISSKKYLETIYLWKKVDVDELWYLQSDHETRIIFRQDYLCPNFFSRGIKKLHLIWTDSSWQIITEDFQTTQPKVYVSNAVNTFLDVWKNDWQNRDYDRYISHYDSSFSNPQYKTFNEWSEYKKRVLAQSQNIVVAIEDTRISSKQPHQWRVRFRQEYTSDNYHDTGYKTLIITGHPLEPEDYQIINESWDPID